MGKKKERIRCTISGRIVTPNKDVVLLDSIEQYIIKQGIPHQEAMKIIKEMRM